MTKKYIYGPGVDNPVAMINVSGASETWYYYYADALGSIRLITNAAGAVVESYTYDPYGKPYVMTSVGTDGNWLTEDTTTSQTSAIGNRLMFTAREWDSVTGLYHYRMRDYSPTLGRFLQPDPIGYYDSMNLYQYCGNNPVNWIDPWGLENTDKYLGGWGKFERGFWGGVYYVADRGGKAWGSVLDKTEGIRGPVGAVVGATGGTLLLVSNPAGWVLGVAAVSAEVGGILTISDFAYFEKFANKVLDKIREPRQKQEETIDQIDKNGLKECPK